MLWLTALLLGFGAVLVSLPLWLPWIALPVLSRLDVQVGSYERAGYSRFVLSDVAYESQAISISAEKLEAMLPASWIWYHYAGVRESDLNAGYLVLDGWRVRVGESSGESKPPNPELDSVAEVLDLVENIIRMVREWVPSIRVGRGAVELAFDEIQVTEISWRQGRLAGVARSKKFEQEAAIDLDFAGEVPVTASIEVTPAGIRSNLQLARAPGRWTLDSQWFWNENELAATAEFDDRAWIPAAASMEAEGFAVPPALVRLDGYAELMLDVSVQWQAPEFAVSINGRAEPAAEQRETRPPVDLAIQASGGLDGAILNQVRVRLPWVELALSEDAAVQFKPPYLTDPASLRLSLDASGIPGVELDGNFDGAVQFLAGNDQLPVTRLTLTGRDVSGYGIENAGVNLGAELDWPVGVVERLDIDFGGGSSLRLVADADLEARLLRSSSLAVSGGFLKAFLPAGYQFDSIDLEASAEGAFTGLSHSGSLRFKRVESAVIAPLDGEVSWDGLMQEIPGLTVSVRAGSTAMNFQGALSRPTDPPGVGLQINELTLNRAENGLYALREPAKIVVSTESDGPPRIQLVDFDWPGADGRKVAVSADLRWPVQGRVHLDVSDFDPVVVAEFVKTPIPAADISVLTIDGQWDGGPIDFNAVARVGLDVPDIGRFHVRAETEGTSQGIRITEAMIANSDGTIANLNGLLPIVLSPAGAGGVVRVNETGPVELHVDTVPGAELWNEIGSRFGLILDAPEIVLNAGGTIVSPSGTLEIQFARVAIEEGSEKKVPDLRRFRAAATLTDEALTLDSLSFEVEGQGVSANAGLPLEPGFVQEWMDTRALPDWRKVRAELVVDGADIQAFEEFLPAIVVPQGTVTLGLRMGPDMNVNGDFRLTGAATRPLLPLGPLRDIESTIRFDGRTAHIERFGADLGGQPIALSGKVSVDEDFNPSWNILVEGDNVPLVREPGMLVRSDLAIRLVQETGELDSAKVTGDVVLRESLLLQDVTQLVPREPSQPSKRPPFFSVPTEPLASWILDLKIVGDQFMRLRTPVFRGLLSANFRLTETLAEPRAIGEARIPSGQIQFPFGNLAIEQGIVSLTSENPFRPQLLITAGSRLYGYDITMEVTGFADEPVIKFTSVPSLNSEEILLMLTAGELPRREMAFTNQQKAGRLALFLGRDLISRLGGDEGSAERLSIRTGEDISEQGKVTYSIEYELTDRWSAVGEYDRFNAVNAGLKFKVFSR